jgi:hypothetical protein
VSRRYEIEWPQTDEPRWVISEWWTCDENDEWIKRPYPRILVGYDELTEWLKDNLEVDLP